MHQLLLKYLQWQSGVNKPWVLKNPAWLGLEPFIVDVFPHANLVMTHRHPNQTIPSTFYLLDAFHAPFSDKPPEYEMLCAGLAMGLEQHVINRQTRRDIKILDISYPEITGPGDALAAKVYDPCGIQFSDETVNDIRKWEAENPIHKLSAFTYDQTDYQLRTEIINQDFASHIKIANKLF